MWPWILGLCQPEDTKTHFLTKETPSISKNTCSLKNWNFLCAFWGDSGIVKNTKSEIILGWQKKFWNILFFCLIFVQNFQNIFSGSGDIHMFVADRQTNEWLPYTGGQEFLLFEKLSLLLTTQILFSSFAPFAGDT